MGERLKGMKAVVPGCAGALGLAPEAEASGVAVAGGAADVRSPGEGREISGASLNIGGGVFMG